MSNTYRMVQWNKHKRTYDLIMVSGVAAEREAVGSGIRFTNGKDLIDIVLPQYEAAFMALMAEATTLDFSSLGWHDDDVARLAVALT